ncbi:MAG: ion transporter [Eubacterium sp.]|nr:ion transporter [Eubacterium sp.]
MNTSWNAKRKRLFEIINIGAGDDPVSRAYDIIMSCLVVLYLVISILETFDSILLRFGHVFAVLEVILVIVFTVDYILRIFTAKYLYPTKSEGEAIFRYIFSFSGIVDLLSFLPYYLPVFFPAGWIAFRMIRVVRIFRLFRVNAYYDSLNVITEVLSSKRQQLISSVVIVLILMLAASLCMYSVEHEAQPQTFKDAFSGIWWSASTLLTVGYGDIYPVTVLGKILGIIITFLGVGMVAIPTGIISAGFVEQYAEMKKRSEYLKEADVLFVKVKLREKDPWIGKRIMELMLPHGLITAAILRDGSSIVPRGNVMLNQGDVIVLGAEPTSDGEEIDLKEIVLSAKSPWVGCRVQDLDISRKTLVVMIRRGDDVIIPRGHHVFEAGDHVYLYTEKRFRNSEKIEV